MEVIKRTLITMEEWVIITDHAKEIVKIHKASLNEALAQAINDYSSGLDFILSNRNIDLWNNKNDIYEAINILLIEEQNTIDLEI
jgi:hypothetical protein